MDFLRTVLIADIARALLLTAAAFVITLIAMRYWISYAQKKQLGKLIRPDGPQSHMVKMGTPTMGGVVIVGAVTVATIFFNLIDRWSMILPLAVMLAYAVMGFFDDMLSIIRSRSQTYGFTIRHKLLLMILIALVASLALYLPNPYGLAHSGVLRLPFMADINVGVWFIPIATFIIVATANAVNLTDGLDSLAGWCLLLAFLTYGILTYLSEPRLTNLMVFSLTLVGACAAFLWYNAHPAQVFMGDTGALALGGVLAVIALQSQQWLLLPVIGVVFVFEALSVIIQTGWFKWTRHKYGEGRRVFRMTPIHHHFELIGWSQTQVTQRFVLISAMAALVGIAIALTFANQPPSTATNPVLAVPVVEQSKTQ